MLQKNTRGTMVDELGHGMRMRDVVKCLRHIGINNIKRYFGIGRHNNEGEKALLTGCGLARSCENHGDQYE